MPFKPGQSGNPGGRKKLPITIELEKIAAETGEDGVTKAALFARRLWEKAQEDVTLMKYVTDRLDGTPVQAIQAEVTEKRPISYDLVYDEADPKTD